MIDNILESIKKSLDIESDYNVFDDVISMHINSVFSTLHSIGASPEEPFMLLDNNEKWTDFYGDVKQAMMVKTYVFLKVKLLFDPPATSFVLDALTKQATELEWRLHILEFVFNPSARPIPPEEQRNLAELERKIETVETQIDTLDAEVDEVPNLAALYYSKLADDD